MSRPVLPRIEIEALKSVSDTLVPTAATVEFYRRAATTTQQASFAAFEEDVLVPAYDTEDLAVGDTLRVGYGSDTLIVTAVEPTSLQLTSNLSHSLTVPAGTRLVPTNDRPRVYTDPIGATTPVTSVQTDATTGRASVFGGVDRLDYEVLVTGESPRIYRGVAGRFGRSDLRVTELSDYGGSLQAALDSLSAEGGAIHVPLGTWPQPPGVVVRKPNVTVFGEGHGSILTGCTKGGDLITVDREYFHLLDLTVDGQATEGDPYGASCVVVRGLGVSSFLVIGTYLENVKFMRAPRHGLWLLDPITTLVRECQFDGNFGSGVVAESPASEPYRGGVTTTHFIGCSFTNNRDRGFRGLNAGTLSLQQCHFEGNTGGTGSAYVGNDLDMVSGVQVQVLSCTFKHTVGLGIGALVHFNFCPSVLVDACEFETTVQVQLPEQRLQRAVTLNNTSFARVTGCVGMGLGTELVLVDALSRNCFEQGNLERLAGTTDFVPARINAGAPDLQLISSSRRSASAPRIRTDLSSRPGSGEVAEGWLLFNENSSKLQVWDGQAWRDVSEQA